MIEWLGSPRSTLGQLTPEALSNVVFSVQAFLNDALQQFGRQPVRADGTLDRATCEALFAWSRGELGALDPTLVEILDDNGAAIQTACDALRGGVVPPPPPPEEPTNPFEQCFVDFGDSSEAIRSVQRQINGQLASRGYIPIPEDGVWNSVTCGALYFLTLTQGVPAEGPGSPFDVPECPGGMTVPTTCPDRVTPQKTSTGTAARGGGAGTGGLLLLAAAALGGIYYFTQVA
jgi:hypothetical protein